MASRNSAAFSLASAGERVDCGLYHPHRSAATAFVPHGAATGVQFAAVGLAPWLAATPSTMRFATRALVPCAYKKTQEPSQYATFPHYF